MTRRLLVWTLILSLPLLINWGCEDSQSYPDTPHIAFHSFTVAPSAKPTEQAIGKLTLTFVDGDADIGFEDTTLTDTFNLFLSTFYRQNSDYNLKFDPVGYRLPEVPQSSYKPHAKGEIELVIPFITIPEDSIKFSVYLYDRLGNKSNIVNTSPFLITLSEEQ